MSFPRSACHKTEYSHTVFPENARWPISALLCNNLVPISRWGQRFCRLLGRSLHLESNNGLTERLQPYSQFFRKTMELILDNLENYSYLNSSDRFLGIEFRHLLKKLHRSEVSNQNLSVIQTFKEQITRSLYNRQDGFMRNRSGEERFLKNPTN